MFSGHVGQPSAEDGKESRKLRRKQSVRNKAQEDKLQIFFSETELFLLNIA
jgi:hypothetical protein